MNLQDKWRICVKINVATCNYCIFYNFTCFILSITILQHVYEMSIHGRKNLYTYTDRNIIVTHNIEVFVCICKFYYQIYYRVRKSSVTNSYFLHLCILLHTILTKHENHNVSRSTIILIYSEICFCDMNHEKQRNKIYTSPITLNENIIFHHNVLHIKI